MIDPNSVTIKGLNKKLISKEISVLDLVDFYKKQIEEKNKEINAYLEVFDDIDVQVQKAQEMIDNGKGTVLTGIPVSIKDNIFIKGHRVGASSKILDNYIAPYNATVINKLKDAGVVFLGRVNMDEFAMGGSTESSAYGVTRNPCDTNRVPGGSSGGSAASVAMSGAVFSLGSDTGGSIRQPASFTGLVGLKPTYGRVSRYGLIAMASSLDQIGPITKNVDDAQIVFDFIKGIDKNDSTTYLPENISSAKKPVIGIPYEILKEGVDEDVLKNFNESVDKLKEIGYQVKDISLPYLKYSLALYYILMPAEVSSNMARFDGVRFGLHKDAGSVIEDYFKTRGDGLGKEVRRRIMLGTYVLSSGYYDAYYSKAQKVRKLLTEDFIKAFNDVDIIATPTSPVLPWKFGEKSKDPLTMYLADIFTVSANLSGIPAISVPSGHALKDSVSLPVGIQFMTNHFREDIIFDVSKKFENKVNGR